MGTIGNVLLVIFATAAGALLTGFALVGTIWLGALPFTGRQWKFPRRATLVLSLVVFALGMMREYPGLSALVQTNNSETGVSALTAIYEAARVGDLGPDQVRSSISAINPSNWTPEAREMILEAVLHKTERYMDLFQSSIRGEVVRTPLPEFSNAAISEGMQKADEKWTPLLAAAAATGEVDLGEESVVGPEELYLMSLLARWAQFELFTALEVAHGVPMPLSETDRVLGPALRWVPAFVIGGPSHNEVPEAFALAADALTAEQREILDLAKLKQAAISSETTAATVAYVFHSRRVDLLTSLSIMDFVLDDLYPESWDSLELQRRALALPLVSSNVDLRMSSVLGRLPEQVDYAGLTIRSENRQLLRAELLDLERRWRELSLPQ